MRWFEGGIAEAVTLSRKNGAIFVVYIEGKCAESERISKLIDADAVSDQLSSNHFVAIKIEGGSVAHKQFAEIYKKVNAPSIFFIATGGVPLEIVETVKDLDDLVHKIDIVKQKGGVKIITPQANAVSDFIVNEQKEVERENDVSKIKPPVEAKSEENVSSTSSHNNTPNVPEPQENMEAGESQKSELSKEEKIEKAKELIEKNKEVKKKEEEEKERQKEIERRKVGQDVLKMKRWQEDQEFKQLIEEREKEKKEQQAARQRVLQQIQQDKEERAARFSNQPGTTAQPATQSPPASSAPKTTPNVARIQFKLPDGSSHNHEFEPDAKLVDLKSYIRENMTLAFNNFVLATMFPRREFSEDDELKTLGELELLPSAVLLILPLAHGTVSTNESGFLSTVIWTFIGPILNLFNYLKGVLFGARPPPDSPGTSGNKRTTEQGETSRLDRMQGFLNAVHTPSPKRRAGETTAIRRQGNIHRLTDKGHSDDETNTWNGNSTEQM